MELDVTVFADRSERAKIRVTGPQRLWFLDQVLTQKFDGMEAGDAREAAMLTVHGRMTAFTEALATEEAVLCHLEPELRERFLEDVSRYVFATRVEISDVTDEMALLLVAGPGWEEAAASVDAALLHPTRSLGVPAAYLWLDPEDVAKAVEGLESGAARRATEEELEAVRISRGVPRWGRDMDSKTFPQEAGIDPFAVHYDKGCYLGQEAMAKIHFRGKVNRRLARLQVEAGLAPGADLFADGKKVGRVTSVAGDEALAMVLHTVGYGVELASEEGRATVVD